MKDQMFQVQMQLGELTRESVLLKIFGHQEFSFQTAYGKSKVDWSGFYTQLNPEHSMRYLTKKWDDGANEACLILLKPLKSLKLIKILSKDFFSNPKISGEHKALKIKQNLRKKSIESQEFEDFFIKDEQVLLKTLGEKQTLLQCVDMDENEIIIPHKILNQKYFQFDRLLVFKKSNDGLLRTIGWKWGNKKQQDQGWKYIKGQCQYEPYLILEEQKQIKNFLQKIKHFPEKSSITKKQNF